MKSKLERPGGYRPGARLIQLRDGRVATTPRRAVASLAQLEELVAGADCHGRRILRANQRPCGRRERRG